MINYINTLFNKRRGYLLLLFLFWNMGLRAQEGSTDSPLKLNVIPPSPTAASLGKYGEVPVGFHTGVPQIAVPIYEIKGKSLRLPISLSYHAGGIRVEEQGSRVGLGWSLNAGGVITRTVRGRPDDSANGYNRTGGDLLQQYLEATTNSEDLTDYQKVQIAKGIYDTEPDLYFYNFNGKSGKFVYDLNGEPKLIPHANLHITKTSQGFEILDETGVKYRFTVKETSWTEGSGNDSPDVPPIEKYTSSWYLSEISDLNTGDVITLKYEENYSYVSHPYKSQTVYFPTDNSVLQPGCNPPMPSNTHFTSHVQGKVLTEIAFVHGNVKFIPGEVRNDVAHSGDREKVLAGIEVYGGTEVQPNRTFNFTYTNVSNSRLWLEAMCEADPVSGACTKNYSFEYNEKEAMPTITDGYYQQDWWGYYNDNPKKDLVPFTTYKVLGKVYFYDGAKRLPEQERASIGLLRKITYPTGGYAEFEYELNDYGFSVEEDRLINVVDCSEKQFADFLRLECDRICSKKDTFTLLAPTCAKIDYLIKRNVCNNEDPCAAGIKILHEDFQLDENIGSGMTQSAKSKIMYVELPAGSYTVEVWSENPFCAECKARLDIKLADRGINEKAKKAGGVRVKKIVRNDGINPEDEQLETFVYRLPDQPEESSGVLVSVPGFEYAHIATRPIGGGVIGEVECPYKVITSSSNIPLGTSQGSVVEYSYVTVFKGDSLVNNGKTVYVYTTSKEYPDSPTAFPYPPRTSYDWRRGLLLEKFDYHSNGQLLMHDSYRYKFSSSNYAEVAGLKIGLIKVSTIENYKFADRKYRNISEWYYQDTVIQRVYDQNQPGKVITTKTVNEYDNPKHLQLTKTTNHRSQGEGGYVKTVNTEYTYPADPGSGAPAEMWDSANPDYRHMHNFPVREVSKVNDQTTSKVTTLYQKDSYGHLHPVSKHLYPNGGSEKITANYQYDANGNVVETQREHDIPTVYLWSYKNTLPVAKLIGKSYVEISNALSNALSPTFLSELGSATDQELVSSKLLQLRGVFDEDPAVQVFTYTYEPLLGMTSVTDANNQTTTYHYDRLGRLETVKDHNGDIVKHYQYNYAQDPELTVSESAIFISCGELNHLIEITSNSSWTAESDQSWLKVGKAAGTGSQTLTLLFEENEGITTRSGKVTVQGGGLTQIISITQDRSCFVEVSVSQLNVVEGEGQSTVMVTSNTNWSAQSDQLWLTTTPGSGSGNGTLHLTYSSNPSSTEPRTATLTVQGEGVTDKTVIVTQ
ncbi:BACON domain-containing carbohydrate-binding protein [Rapidithrix thailandica]|uniref:BACON domain-containing carbohydrate-binding protein n=1 Tax=Rapidithrix thailandica TaxID=413964 RepID=A0AAW9RX16_9BACT